ncbi:hypothetical protein AACH06_21270 [Ideonella sp. DXS29W]|uniref:Uncharacterized protein n=1 Tax=Ideonella lacteola TaxID=2984193 RepID=A0ABU9BTR1_9BURK
MPAIVWIIQENSRPARPACSTMSCMGTGIGDAVLMLAIVGGALTIGTLLNVAGFLCQARPRSMARKLEMSLLFVAPFSLILALGVAFVS